MISEYLKVRLMRLKKMKNKVEIIRNKLQEEKKKRDININKIIKILIVIILVLFIIYFFQSEIHEYRSKKCFRKTLEINDKINITEDIEYVHVFCESYY